MLAGLFAGGSSWFASTVSHMTTPANPAKANAIIVLTDGPSRLDAAMDLLLPARRASADQRRPPFGQSPPAPGRNRGRQGAVLLLVDIDRAALDTMGDAEESAQWIESHAYGTVILVADDCRMPRSLLEMSRLLRGARLEPYPVVNANLGDRGSLSKPEALRVC